jgi:acyl-CoA synthetase (AMP-forming)/AMP-acid ligase II
LGAKKGDVMAMLLPNCIEYPMIFAAGPGIGVTITTLNPIYTAAEIAKQLKLSNASWAVTSHELLPTLLGAIQELGSPDAWKGKILIVGSMYMSYNTMCQSY